jgi:hypothetical protein
MASFDIIGAAGYGYQLAWREKRYLARLATIPLFVKFCCLLVIMLGRWTDSSLLATLILLPSFFADGWMLSHYVRLIFLDQRWPFRPGGDPAADRQELQDRSTSLMAGTLVFVVSRFLAGGQSAWFFHLLDQINQVSKANPPQLSTGTAVIFLATTALSLWAFRFLWFYIPAVLGYNLRRCVRDLRGIAASFYIIGLAVICSLPTYGFQYLIASMAAAPYDLSHPATLPLTFDIFLAMLDTAAETIIAFIATGAMAYAFYEMLGKKTNDRKSR